MANTKEGNVIFVDTTATVLTGPLTVEAVKYMGNTNGTAEIVSGSSKLWAGRGTADMVDQVCFRANNGITVNVTNGATVYIYLK